MDSVATSAISEEKGFYVVLLRMSVISQSTVKAVLKNALQIATSKMALCVTEFTTALGANVRTLTSSASTYLDALQGLPQTTVTSQ
jgi:hypothetical protein